MTIDQFTDDLCKSYSRPIPGPQLGLVGRLVEQALPEHAYVNFLDFILSKVEHTPNAAKVKACLNEWLGMAHPEEEQVDAATYRCIHGICDGTKFVTLTIPASTRITRIDGEEFADEIPEHDTAYLCRCHAGHGRTDGVGSISHDYRPPPRERSQRSGPGDLSTLREGIEELKKLLAIPDPEPKDRWERARERGVTI